MTLLQGEAPFEHVTSRRTARQEPRQAILVAAASRSDDRTPFDRVYDVSHGLLADYFDSKAAESRFQPAVQDLATFGDSIAQNDLPIPADDDGGALPPPSSGDSLPPLPPAGEELGPPPAGGDLPPPPGGDLPPPGTGDDLPPAGVESDDAPLPFPLEGDDEESASGGRPLSENEVDLPVFGVVNAREIGMPAFTIAIGLVDGFNPCAMWVLLFLLSLLVNLKSRAKMFAIAGVFVLISGIAYFAFMAAWLNVFLFIGYLQWVQYLLGTLSVIVGAIHIKDFFAFKKGVSLSIPESAKPGIYERTRRIVTAETMWAALGGAIVLAVLVNIIELLCTAGLPAIYTKVLTMQDYPTWKYYAYLGLYNLAYMFDDSIMVIIAVATLGKRRLQEKEGRWLKLISGLLIFSLGVLMLINPNWLSQGI